MKMTRATCLTLGLALLSTISQAGEHTVIQVNKGFDKKEITIKAGDTITFENKEKDITHNVYSLGPKNGFELKSQLPGQKSSVQFKEPGTTDVECAIHNNMKLKVNVTK